jgi:KTSC domain
MTQRPRFHIGAGGIATTGSAGACRLVGQGADFWAPDIGARNEVTRLAFMLALLFTAQWEEAEIVDVKDSGPIDLAPFTCQDVTRSSVIGRVCYDTESRRMLVQRHAVYQQYCDVPKETIDALLNAPSMGQYFNANIKPAGHDGNVPYGCRIHKAPLYQ